MSRSIVSDNRTTKNWLLLLFNWRYISLERTRIQQCIIAYKNAGLVLSNRQSKLKKNYYQTPAKWEHFMTPERVYYLKIVSYKSTVLKVFYG